MPTATELVGRTGRGAANGTLGELLQGQTAAGEDVLVTFPIDVWSHVTVEINSSGEVTGPSHKPKSRHMVELVMQRLGAAGLGAHLTVECQLSEGRGLASSTADVVAAARAVCDATGLALGPTEIADLAVRIEPSDGVMWDGVVAFNHREGRLLQHLGHLPPLRVLAVDLGSVIDTIEFNKRPKDYSQQERRRCQDALDMLAAAIAAGDLRGIGAASTESALLHQRVLPKPELPVLLEICEESGGFGVNVAHSGTVVGLIFAPGDAAGMERARDLVGRRLPVARPFDVRPLNCIPMTRGRLSARV